MPGDLFMTTSISPSSAASIPATASRWGCDGLIEGAWLAAAVVVPLVFTQRALDSYEPYKAAMVRLLAAIIAAAWVVNLFLSRKITGTSAVPRSVGVALTALLGAQLLSTLFSINPHASWWGGAQTSQGLFDAVAEAVLFLAVAGGLRGGRQIDRLVTALVATTIPVSFYALAQRAGIEPAAVLHPYNRATSTLGYPIYLAAYLSMVMPLTWWKIARTVQSRETRPQRNFPLFFYTGLAVVQMAAFIGAESRGPFLGLMATAVIFGLGWLVLTRQWHWWRRGGVLAGIAVAFFVFLNLPLPSSIRIAQAIGVGRLANSLGLREGPEAYRKAHWEAAVQLMISPKPIAFPNGGEDRWHQLRMWIGYGPETLENVLPTRYMWPGTDVKPENRLHNRILDLWYAMGIIGVLAFFSFFLAVFEKGLEAVGLGARGRILLIVPGLTVVGGVLFWVIGGRGFLGLGVIVGLVVGCALRILVAASPREEPAEKWVDPAGQGLLSMALLAALVGHLLETGFAFVVPVTSLLFCLYAGMIIALGQKAEEPAPEAVAVVGSGKSRRGRPASLAVRRGAPWRDALLAAYGPTLMLSTLLFAFMQMYSPDAVDWTTVLGRTLTQIKGNKGPSHLLWWLFLPTWSATSYAFAAGTAKETRMAWWKPLAISAGIAGAYAIISGVQIVSIGPLPRQGDPAALAVAQIAGYHGLYFTMIGLVVVLVLGAGWVLSPAAAKAATWFWRPAGWNLLVGGLGLAAAWFLALRDIRADLTATWGNLLYYSGDSEAATEVFRQSLFEKPDSSNFRRELGGTLVLRTQRSQNFAAFDELSHEAENVLLPAMEQVHGLSTAAADLGQLYLDWAAVTPDANQRRELTQKAEASFEQQLRFVPGHPLPWFDSAVLDEFQQHPEQAERKLQTAVGMMMNWRVKYWANFYSGKSIECRAPDLRAAYARLAFGLLEIAIRESPEPAEAALLRMQRATLNLVLGHTAEARQECLEAESTLAAGERWQAEAGLAEIERRAGNFAEAMAHVEKASEIAPAEQKVSLLYLRRRVESHSTR